ncbi:hypothetical protein [Kouleothrix sp.]|uniref:hypothetical protein n=1 Tax=Kouleothrix sp. TaxID=2779161 RepID=UPI003918EF57
MPAGKTVWMAALIVGLIIGLLSANNESLKTPRDGVRYGLLNGVAAGVVLDHSLVLLAQPVARPAGGQTALDIAIGTGAAGSALVAGLIGLVDVVAVAAILSASQHLAGIGRTPASLARWSARFCCSCRRSTAASAWHGSAISSRS